MRSAPLCVAMAPLALLLAACALLAPHARAASISSDAHRKIPAILSDDNKQPAPAESPLDDVDLSEPVKQIDNELRAKPEIIPVKVVLDEAESLKINEVDDVDIQRPSPDLRNPGPPQRQEHETQNPEQHSDELLKFSTIKDTIERTHALLKKSVQDVSENIENWMSSNGPQINVQKNIDELRESFTNQIQKLNDTIQAFVNPEVSEPQADESVRKYETVESRLKTLKDNFDDGVETLSAGVELYASLKSAEDVEAVKEETPGAEAAAAPTKPAEPGAPAKPTESSTAAPAQNFLQQWMQNWSNTLASNVNAIQNAFRPPAPAPPAAAQADTPDASSTASPPPWRPITDFINNNRPPQLNLNFTNPFNYLFPNNSGQPGPLSNVIPSIQNSFQSLVSQNPISNLSLTQIPVLGNIANYFRPGASTEKPAEANSSGGTVPATDPKPEADKPAVVVASQPAVVEPAASQPAAASESQPGPIRQFLNNIPVVQRIQNSITNRDTPRQPAAAAAAAEKSDSQNKGGFYGGPKPGASGNNNDVDSGLSEKKPEVEEPVKEEEKKKQVVELKPEPVLEKTE